MYFCARKSVYPKYQVIQMTNVIKLRKGLDINVKGAPTTENVAVDSAALYALMPDDFYGVTPKVVVKPEEHVEAGGALFIDKNHPEVKFVSPVSGTVKSVTRGARRKVMNVTVQPDAEQVARDFGVQNIANMDAAAVQALLMESGLFGYFRQRPYDVVPDPSIKPRAIFVSAFDSAPMAPDFEIVLKGQEAAFQVGLDTLAKIAKTYLGVSVRQSSVALTAAKNVEINYFDGAHPAGVVGVQINNVAPVNKGETVWTIGAEEVIFIGRLMTTGKVDFSRVITLTGEGTKKTGYAQVVVGAQIESFAANMELAGQEMRIISGNVLTGTHVQKDEFLGAHSTQLAVIPENLDPDEPFGWIMPRFKQFSVNRSYFSWLFGKKKEYSFDARLKGEERHMIMSGEYEPVFPMDILPEFLLKAIIAGNIDEMEALGIYEVAPEDFALCEFVCSSKVEIQRIVREGLDMLRDEMC